MNIKILLATVDYISQKPNPNPEDLKNEKRVWGQLIELGLKKESDVPDRVKEMSTSEGGIQNDTPATPKKKTTTKAVLPK